MLTLEQIASLYGVDRALEALAGLAVVEHPNAEIVVVSYCESSSPRFDVGEFSRAEVIALMPGAACALACEPCDRSRHVVAVTCDGTDHKTSARLLTVSIDATEEQS